MQFYYGGRMPLRVLDECEFWKQQEEEHTVVIQELVPNLGEEYLKILKEWRSSFVRTHQRVIRFIETAIRSTGTFSYVMNQEFIKLVQFCLEQSQRFIAFCNMLIHKSEPIKNNSTAIVVMKHIINESEYFIGIAQTILYQPSF